MPLVYTFRAFRAQYQSIFVFEVLHHLSPPVNLQIFDVAGGTSGLLVHPY